MTDEFQLSEALDAQIASACTVTPVATLSLHGPGGAVLERLLHHVSRAREARAS